MIPADTALISGIVISASAYQSEHGETVKKSRYRRHTKNVKCINK